MEFEGDGRFAERGESELGFSYSNCFWGFGVFFTFFYYFLFFPGCRNSGWGENEGAIIEVGQPPDYWRPHN